MAAIEELTREISIMIPKLMKGARSRFLSNLNISSSQMIMLVSIYDHGKCNIKTLVRERSISPPTATGIIDRLEKSGYVRRENDPADRRAVLLSLTPKGERLVKKFLESIKERWRNILVRLSPAERKQYLNILKKIVSILSEDGGRPE